MEIRIKLEKGPVTGVLILRSPTPDEEFEFCDAKARVRGSGTRERVAFFNKLLVGAEALVVHGQPVGMDDPLWPARIPVTYKEAICLRTFEAVQLLTADDEKNSAGLSE